MKAVVQDRYGSPDVLRLSDVDQPVPAADEVLIRVRAASINARDWHVMRGDPYVARLMDRRTFGRRGPTVAIRGTDYAGTVAAVGERVSRWKPGDEVYGEAPGAFAEYVRVREGAVDHKPANLSFEEAAAVPLAGNTALIGLRDVAAIRPGQRLLINGASGGVGTFAIQLGRWLGADVTGVCSTRNLDLVRHLGAGHVIDYTTDDFARAPQRYDVVLDLVGNRSLRDLRRVLTPQGTLVLSGGGVSTGGTVLGPMRLMVRALAVGRFVRHRVRLLSAAPDQANLATLRELIEAGTIKPVVDRVFPLGEAAAAIRYMEVEHAKAKVVLSV